MQNQDYCRDGGSQAEGLKFIFAGFSFSHQPSVISLLFSVP